MYIFCGREQVFRASPRQSDVMIVAGTLCNKMAPALRKVRGWEITEWERGVLNGRETETEKSRKRTVTAVRRSRPPPAAEQLVVDLHDCVLPHVWSSDIFWGVLLSVWCAPRFRRKTTEVLPFGGEPISHVVGRTKGTAAVFCLAVPYLLGD